MSKRYYTVAQANGVLPELRRRMAELQQAREDIAVRRLQLSRLRREGDSTGAPDPDRFFLEEAEIEFILITARQLIDQLIERGIEVKDIDAGLVDFLTLIDGEEAYLCWRSGEPEVRYWHGLDEGFAGRRRIAGDARFDPAAE